MKHKTILLCACLLALAATAIAQSPDEFYERGLANIRKGEFEEAAANFSKTLDSLPSHTKAHYHRAFVYTALERHEEALEDYNFLINKGIKQDKLYYSRGTSYYSLEQYGKAIADYNKALELTEDEKLMQEVYNNRGWARKKSGDDQGACDDWERSEDLGNEEAERFLDDYSNDCD